MGIEDGLCKAACLEQAEAKKHRVTHAGPDGAADVRSNGNALNQYSVDGNAYNDEKCLESQSKQGTKIILAHAAPFLAHHSCHRDGRKGGYKVNLDHSAVGNDEDTDGDCPGADASEQGLKPQSQQRSDLHIHEPGFQIGHYSGNINAGISGDNTRCTAYHALCSIKYTHDDVPCICDD